MASIRLSKLLKELNIGLDRAVEFLAEKGHDYLLKFTKDFLLQWEGRF